jgi:nucleotide-binding universal stress UspA family protein
MGRDDWGGTDAAAAGDEHEDTNYRIEHGGGDAVCRGSPGSHGTPRDGESAVRNPTAPAIAGAPATAAVPRSSCKPAPRKKRSAILPRRILVAVDRSEQSRWALKLACELALSLKTELVLLHVVDSPCTFASHFAAAASAAAPVSPQTQEGVELLHEIAACVPPTLSPLKVLRHGEADREIVAAAAEWDAELIVIGTHGRGHVSKFFFLLGSVAGYVLRYAECPVITVSDDLTPYLAADSQQPEPQAAEAWQDSLVGMG